VCIIIKYYILHLKKYHDKWPSVRLSWRVAYIVNLLSALLMLCCYDQQHSSPSVGRFLKGFFDDSIEYTIYDFSVEDVQYIVSIVVTIQSDSQEVSAELLYLRIFLHKHAPALLHFKIFLLKALYWESFMTVCFAFFVCILSQMG
jgi:hypothetical protein